MEFPLKQQLVYRDGPLLCRQAHTLWNLSILRRTPLCRDCLVQDWRVTSSHSLNVSALLITRNGFLLLLSNLQQPSDVIQLSQRLFTGLRWDGPPNVQMKTHAPILIENVSCQSLKIVSFWEIESSFLHLLAPVYFRNCIFTMMGPLA